MRLLSFFCFLIVLLWACQSDSLDRTTKSGYHYLLHKEGSGPSAQPGQYVYYHVQMRYLGKVRQNSRTVGNQPYFVIPLEEQNNDTPGALVPVQEILKELSVGDSVTIDIPVDEIPGNISGFRSGDTVFYDLVVTDIKTQEEYEAKRRELIQERRLKIQNLKARAPKIASDLIALGEQYKTGALDDLLQTTSNGLKYLIIEEGVGSRADTGSYVTVYYCGATLSDGNIFDNAFAKASPYSFNVGQARAIKGWEIGLPKFKNGGKGYLFIPPELGYGAEGKAPIPPNAELIFYIELDNVVKLNFKPEKEVD